MSVKHKENPGAHTVKPDDMARVLERGFDIAERDKVMEDAMLWFLQDYAADGVEYRNSDVCRAILSCVDADVSLKRSLSFYISSMSKSDRFKPYTRPGKPWVKNNYKTGEKTKIITRVWVSEMADDDHVKAVDKHIERNRVEIKTDARLEQKEREAADFLLKRGYVVKAPDELDANEVDNSDVSRHPKPGFTKVTCGTCGGMGRVFVKQE